MSFHFVNLCFSLFHVSFERIISFAGVGFGVLVISFLCTIYYNVLISYVLYYMYESLKIDVPWRNCNNEWNTKNCVEDYKTYTESKYVAKPFEMMSMGGLKC